MVPRTNEDTARAIHDLVKWLDDFSPVPNAVYTFGYGDTPEQRQQLRETIQAHVTRDLRQKLVEIDGKQRSRGRTGERFRESTMGDLLALGAMIAEFEDVLGESLRDVRATLEMYESLIQRQLER